MTLRSTPDLSCTSPHGSDARDQYSKTTLLCLDFDLTLTQTHLFQYTASMIREGFGREEAILRAIRLMEHQGPRGGEELWSVLAMWLNHGHALAVTSFTAFPELPIALLAKGVSKVRAQGVSKERIRWLSRPLIIYGDPAPELNPTRPLPHTELVTPHPESGVESGKNQHIEAALRLARARGVDVTRAVLMDDDSQNIALAEARGHCVIEARRDDLKDMSHLARLKELIKQANAG